MVELPWLYRGNAPRDSGAKHAKSAFPPNPKPAAELENRDRIERLEEVVPRQWAARWIASYAHRILLGVGRRTQ